MSWFFFFRYFIFFFARTEKNWYYFVKIYKYIAKGSIILGNSLEKLVDNNEFPIVFIGAGIPKRFLVDFPNWTDLLKKFSELIGDKISMENLII